MLFCESSQRQKGNLTMFRRIVLIAMMSAILAGATTTSTSIPVLLMMGCLIVLALFASIRGEQQG